MRVAKTLPTKIHALALTALLFGAQVARAQHVESSVDAGGMALRYADTLNTGAGVVNAHGLVDWGRAVTDASGTFSQFTSGGWSTQGALSGSFFSAPTPGILVEIGGFAGGSVHHDGTQTGEILANLRLHNPREWGELFAGGGAGRTSFGDGPENIIVAEAGVSTRVRGIDATLVVSPVAVDSLRYADSQLSASWSRGSFDFQTLLGFRVGDQLTNLGATARTWGSVSAVAWIKRYVAVVFAGGAYPIDPTQGFPGGRFLSASIRLARGNARQVESSAPTVSPAITASVEAPVVERFRWQRSGAHQVTLRVNAPRASSVEVNGDFTSWTPVRLTGSSDGWWTVTLPLDPGKYQMNLRIDGGKWIVPPGLLSISDEFGGAVGLLIVE